MNEQLFCKTCRRPKANFNCGLCHELTCKSCAQFLGEDTFSFLKKIPNELHHNTYCAQCFDEKVSHSLSEYESTMDKAKNVMVFTKDETKKTGHLKRKEAAYLVENCEDEGETILRLAFYAAQDGFNCLLDVELRHKKIIVGSHKKTIYSGTATPITIDPTEVREY
jgi:hypothetical protein